MSNTRFPSFRAFLLGATLLGTALATKAQDTDVWPLVFTSGDDQVQVFKPQPESFDGTRFTARAAVALQRPQDANPLFGAIWGNGVLEVDRDARMGKLATFKVTDARFPQLTDAAEVTRLKDMLSTEIPQHSALISIDWLVGALEEEKQSTASYENDPPQVIYREKPSVLVYIDGDPIFQPLKDVRATGGDPVYETPGKPVERVVNTPFLIVRPKGDDLYLYGSGLWYSAEQVQGPWKQRTDVPDYLKRIASSVDSTAALTSTDGSPTIPDVVVSTKPAVLVDLNGPPQMQPYNDTSLMYVTNTDDDLFMDIPTQEYYLLASGRWYATKSLQNGPWRFVPADQLPADFASVPEGSAKDGILAHVPGTPAAREAVRDAFIPQTARVDRSTATVTVTYDGDPQFERIASTNVYHAINASTTVLRINGVYHVCDNAVWYEGPTPDGPWTVSTSVPAEVNDIPPSSSAYNVRYVYIYDSTPDAVFVGYTPGYLGCYVQGGTVIYGTGYYYRPWPGYWYPRPYTWGFNMYYDPWIGWSFGLGWGHSWIYPGWNYWGYYRPYSWGWWGPYSYCPHVTYHHHSYYGHRPSWSGRSGGVYDTGRPGRAALRGGNLYTNREVKGVRPTVTAHTPGRTADTGKRPATTQGLQPMKPLTNDHFTDSKGNVYREDRGRTESFQNGRWSRIPTPSTKDQRPAAAPPSRTPTTAPPGRTAPPRTAQPEPQRIQQDRSRGQQRENDFNGYRQQRMRPPAMQQAPRPTPSVRPSAPPRGNGGGDRGGGGGGRSGGGGWGGRR